MIHSLHEKECHNILKKTDNHPFPFFFPPLAFQSSLPSHTFYIPAIIPATSFPSNIFCCIRFNFVNGRSSPHIIIEKKIFTHKKRNSNLHHKQMKEWQKLGGFSIILRAQKEKNFSIFLFRLSLA